VSTRSAAFDVCVFADAWAVGSILPEELRSAVAAATATADAVRDRQHVAALRKALAALLA
jgi:hypothetical protein